MNAKTTRGILNLAQFNYSTYLLLWFTISTFPLAVRQSCEFVGCGCYHCGKKSGATRRFLRNNILGNELQILQIIQFPPSITANHRQNRSSLILGGPVPPLRLERRLLPPEGSALSTELWGLS